MSIFEYDEERHMEQERKSSYAQGEQDGYNRGKQDGYNKGKQTTCISIIVKKKNTLSAGELADILDVPTSFVEKVCALAEQYPEAAAEELAALLGE